jgi:hypothetical protein
MRTQYQVKATLVVEALFPQITDEAKNALVWLITDLLSNLDAIAKNDS